jgi:electron transfer flavoprotein alpha subunit
VIAEHNNAKLSANTLSAVSAASKFGDVTVLVAGNNCSSVAEEASNVASVSKVLLSQDGALEKGLAENITNAALNSINSGDYTHVVAPSSNFGKNYIPRLAAELDVAPITDVTDIVDGSTFVRPMYAGNALATVTSSDSLKLMTVRTTAFEKSATSGGSGTVEDLAVTGADAGLSTFVSEALSSSDRPDLTTSRVVVSGGRGMKSGENFGMLEELADKLGGAVGASRAAVDAGYVPNELQIGQTGKVVAPELYIAVGISGAIQHLSGMKDSKTIVAINKDPDAPILQVSDYGLVADLFDAVPELTSKV